MLDMKFVRENPDAVKENIKKKFQDQKLPLVDEVIALDAENRAVITEASELRAQRNKLSKSIGALMGQGKKEEAEEVKKQVTAQAQRLKELEAREEELEAKVREIMMVIPNMMWKCSALARRKRRTLKSPITPTSWSALTASIWTAPAVWPATDSTISWATLPACTRQCWPMPVIL